MVAFQDGVAGFNEETRQMKHVFGRARLGLVALLALCMLGQFPVTGFAQDATPVAQPSTEAPTVVVPPTDVPQPTLEPSATSETSPVPTDVSPAATPTAESAARSQSIQALAATLVSPVDPTIVQASCTNGVISPPTVTPVTTTGITYQVSGTPAAGSSTVVSATLNSTEFAFGPIPDNWFLLQEFVAIATFDLDPNPPCTDVVPVAPTVVQASCAGGSFAPPSVTLPANTAVISYSLVGQAAVGRSVIVTADLERDGDAWSSSLPSGWSVQGEFAILSVGPFAKAPCTPAVPIVVEATCRDGVGTRGSVTLPPNTSAIAYLIQSSAGTDVVIASLRATTFAWANPLPTGWIVVDATAALFEVDNLDRDPCMATSLVATGFFHGVIGDYNPGETIDLTPIVPASPGITYTVTGIATPGRTITVTAELHDGYDWPDDLPAGWIEVDEDTAIYRFVLAGNGGSDANPDVPAVSAPSTDRAAPAALVTSLPSTGAGPGDAPGSGWVLLVSVLLLAMAALVGRRHRKV
jgi:hypothetical protein